MSEHKKARSSQLASGNLFYGGFVEKLREPIRTLVGRFEPLARKTSQNYSRSLQKFFSMFPRKSSPEQFSLADILDYREWRREEGAPYSTVRSELCTVHGFFSWLQEAVPGYEELPQPVVIPPWPERVEQTNLLSRPSRASSLS
jgi:hypothetical protein